MSSANNASTPSKEEAASPPDYSADSEDIMIDGEELEIPEKDLETMDDRITQLSKSISSKLPDNGKDDYVSDSEPEEEGDDVDTEHEDPIRHKRRVLEELPTADDVDLEASVISDLETVRGQVRSMQDDIKARDNEISKLNLEVRRLNTAIKENSAPINIDKMKDDFGKLWTMVTTMRAELTEMSARNQEERQLAERKIKKELSKSSPAPIIAAKPEVPTSIITPGESVSQESTPESPIRTKKKKAVRYT